MTPSMFLFFSLHDDLPILAFVSAACLQRQPSGGRRRLGSLYVSTGASLVPHITLVLFIRVFIIGGSSNVAQLAGEAGFGLWSLWAGAWLPLFCGSPVAFVV